MDTLIGKRLRTFRERTKTKMPAIARATGIAKDNLYKWERGHKPSNIEEYNRLCNYLDDMESIRGYSFEEPVTEYKSNMNRRTASVLVSIYFDPMLQPELYTGGKAIAGMITEFKRKPALIAYENDSVHYGQADGLIQVPDKAMEPRMSCGSLITINRLDPDGIRSGNCYCVIDKYHQVLIRKLYPLEEKKIRMVSENEKEYPAVTMDWKEIKALFWIGKVIKEP